MILKDVQKYVLRYLEATESEILEKSSYHIKVKLSPQADKELTNRPFYWSFVERSNEKPETLSFCFIFDPVKYEQLKQEEEQQTTVVAVTAEEKLADSILERTFGPIKPIARITQEHLYYGSPRLSQIFSSTKQNGSFVCMFEEAKQLSSLHPLESKPYTVWLGINYKIEYCCDKKREELYSLGISLVTGFITEQFYDQLLQKKLSPKLPSNVHIAKNALTYTKAVQLAEQYIERKLKQQDYTWAKEANERLEEELARIEHYYEPLLKQELEEEQLTKIKQQYEQRKDEIRWQFEPRIQATVINCGLFHLEGIN